MVVKPVIGILLALAVTGIAIATAACAPASLGSPTASERKVECRAGETLVCRARDSGRVGKDEEPEYDYCTCESLNDGLRL